MINNRSLQNVMIKGTKDGLTLHLDDSCSIQNIIEELKGKLSTSFKRQGDELQTPVNLHTGNRKFSPEVEKTIISTIHSHSKLVVEKVLSNVLTIEECNQRIYDNEVKKIVGIVRSGQVLEAHGDILLIGDINPGGEIKAAGNVFVIGTVRGVVHAGCEGNREAIFAASKIIAAQISIADVHTTISATELEDSTMQYCAYINEQNEIELDRLNVLKHLRPKLTRLEGGL